MPKQDNFSLICEKLSEKIINATTGQGTIITPTGIQEDMIHAVAGIGRHVKNPRVLEVITANKVGKTTMLIGGILRNIFWKPEPDKDGNNWFNHDFFNKFPFPKDGRIIGTATNVQDDGPIQQEIRKWWPKNRYKAYYKKKGYLSYYEIDGDDGIYTFNVMSFDQQPKQFEGPVKGWTFIDEPPPVRLLGPIFSRFYKGGLLMLGMTPLQIGAVLDTIGDMQLKGARVNRVSATIYENSSETGKSNSKGTKKGLMTDEEIKDYETTIPEDEKDERLLGKISSKSGKIYPTFKLGVHVRDFDLMSDYMKRANHYMVMDPHPKYYPFMQWWAVTEDEKFYCYNEWPKRDTMKAYYDEIRMSKPCSLTIEQISNIIKIWDYSQIGYKILDRWPDPRFVSAYSKAGDDKSGSDKMARTFGFIEEFSKHGINFTLPPNKRIAVQRDKIREFLAYDPMLSINEFNEPKIYWHPQCQNSIRAAERHSWNEDKQTESETFKDPWDCTRMFLDGLGKKGYIRKEIKKLEKINDDIHVAEYLDSFQSIGLS